MSVSTYDIEKSNLLNKISTKAIFIAYLDKLIISKILQIIYTKYGEVILTKDNKPYFTIFHDESSDTYKTIDDRQNSKGSLVKKKYVDVLYDLTVGSKNINYSTKLYLQSSNAAQVTIPEKRHTLTSAEKELLKQISPKERLRMLTRFRSEGVLKRDIDVAFKELGPLEVSTIVSHLSAQDKRNLLEASTNQMVRKTLNEGIADSENVEPVNRPILDALRHKPLYTLDQFEDILLELCENAELNKTKEIYIIYTDSRNTIRKKEGIPIHEVSNVDTTDEGLNVYKIDRSSKFERNSNNGTIRALTISYNKDPGWIPYRYEQNIVSIEIFTGDGNKQLTKSFIIKGVKQSVNPNNKYYSHNYINYVLVSNTNMNE